MRLIACYIENYGKIKGASYDFSQNITSFCEENGAGKSTLASFIKAMFFGLKTFRKGEKEFGDRQHFYPFDGGRFGGNLTFEWQGNTYKIERFFDETSETRDSLTVYCNGEPTEILGEDIGKTVFCVDEPSFKRTIFLSAEDMEIQSTSIIQAQLDRVLEGNGKGEEYNFDDALKILEKGAKIYKKSRAGTDKISEEARRIDKLNADIENALAIKRALEGKYVRAALLEEEITALNAQIREGQVRNERYTQLESYHRLLADVERDKLDLQALQTKYPNGLPTLEETDRIAANVEQEKTLQTKLEGGVFSAQDELRLQALSMDFCEGVPTERTLSAVQEDMDALSGLLKEREIVEGRACTEKETRLRATFARKPTAEALLFAEQTATQYKKVKTEYEETPAVLSVEQTAQKTGSKLYLWLAILAIALCIGGGVALALRAAVGTALLVLGGVLLLADGFLYLNAKSAKGGTATAENPEKRVKERELLALEDSLKAFLFPYGYYSGNGLLFDFGSLKKDLAELEAFEREELNRQGKLQSLQREIERLDNGLKNFLSAYALTGDSYLKRLTDLRLKVKDYYELTERKKQAQADRQVWNERLATEQTQVVAFAQKYALERVDIPTLTVDIKDYHRLKKEIAEGEQKANAYREEKGLTDESVGEKIDVEGLQDALTKKTQEKSHLDIEITNDESVVEQLDGYEEEKKQAKERQREYEQKHKLLLATVELLNKADGQLRDRYVKPIKDEFLYYADILEKTLGEKVVMTKDFELRFERSGAERSEKHLSSGQRSVCALCFRLALIKNMYKGNLPFLILDDPFVALDEEHLQKTRTLLETLSKDMQMVYFTCHDSRKL